jgi:hypothetical protein
MLQYNLAMAGVSSGLRCYQVSRRPRIRGMCSYISRSIGKPLHPLLILTTHPTEKGSDLTVNLILIQSDSDAHHDSGRCSSEAI